MAVTQCQQKIVMTEKPESVRENTPVHKKKRMLGFGIGEDIYSIDLNEAIDVIRDLMLIQSYTTRSMTEQFIKCNRRHTIVFNLDQCLSLQGMKQRKPASFVLLDEKIDDACVGILVPGIPSSPRKAHAAFFSPRHQGIHNNIPVRAVKRNPKQNSRTSARSAIPVLDLRELVDRCIVHLRYMDSIRQIEN